MCVCVCVNKMGNKIGYTWMESTFRNPHLPIRVCSSKLTDDTVFDSFLLSDHQNNMNQFPLTFLAILISHCYILSNAFTLPVDKELATYPEYREITDPNNEGIHAMLYATLETCTSCF